MPVETMPMGPADRVNAGPAAYLEPEEAGPTAGEAYRAGFVRQQAALSWAAETENKATVEAVDGYDQFKDIPDDLISLPMDVWSGVQSPVQMQNRVTDVRTQLERDGDVQGFAGFMGEMTGFIANPEVLLTLGIGGLGMRGATALSRVGKGAAFGAVGDLIHEGAMQETQELRTAQESVTNIGAAAVLTGLISGAFGKTVAAPLTRFAYKEMAENVDNFGMRSIGSAQSYDYNSEKILNQPWITSGMLSPMRPLVASKSGESLWWLNNLWEHSYTTGKTLDGRAQQIAMETEVEQQIAILMRTNNQAVNGGYKKYVGAGGQMDLMKGVIKNRGKRAQFDEDVHRAMVNDDTYVAPNGRTAGTAGEIAAVEETAKVLRSEIYDVTLKIAKEAELIDPEDFATRFAKSYAPRRWNKKAVIKDQIAFKQALKEQYREDMFLGRTKEADEATGVAQKELDVSEQQLVTVADKAKKASDAHAAAQSSERTSLARVRTDEKRAKQALAAAKKAQKASAKAQKAEKGTKGTERVDDAGDEVLQQAEDSAIYHREAVTNAKRELDEIRTEVRQRKQTEKEQGNIDEPVETLDSDGNVKRTYGPKGNRAEPEAKTGEGNVVEGRSPEAVREAERIEDLKAALDDAKFIANESDEALKALKVARASKDADAAAKIAKAEAHVARTNAKSAKSILTMARQIRRVRSAQKKLWDRKLGKAQRATGRVSEGVRAAKSFSEQDFSLRTGADDQYIRDEVEDTFKRIAYGYDQDVFMGIGALGSKGLGSPLTARKIGLEDNFLLDKGWLDSNMEAMTMSHINHMLKPSAMKMKAGDVEMQGVIESIEKNYGDLIEAIEKKVTEATDEKQIAKLTKEARRLGKEQTDVLSMHRLMRDRWYGRRSVPSTRLGAQVNDFLRAMRNYNTALMMGMVLPTSIGDVARWNMATIYAPEMGVTGPSMLQAFRTMGLNKAQMQKIGIAHEVATQLRTAKIIDGSDILGSHGTGVVMDSIVHASSATSKALIKATLLTQWTDFGKLMSASFVQNDLIQKAMGYAKLSGKSKQALARMGFDEDMATAIRKEVQEGLAKGDAERGINRVNMSDMGYKGSATVIDYDKIADKNLSEQLQKIIFRESERSLVTPRTGDMPMWLGDTEAGRTVGQFTTFLHAAVQQVGVPIGKRLRYDRDPKAAILASQMMMGGAFSVMVRHGIQGRLDEMDEWTAMDWALNAADYSGVVPLQMYLFNGLNLLSKGGLAGMVDATTMTRTTNRPIASVAGPTAGSLSNLVGVAQIPFSESGITESEARKIRRAMLWNNLMYFTAKATELEKSVSGDEQ